MLDLKTCTKDKSLKEKVKRHILKNKLIDSKDTVIVALSGGADSVCLLLLLSELKDELGFSLKAAHLNHGIRGDEAKRDEEFSKNLCKKLEIEIFTGFKDIPALSGGKNTELIAREERYAFLNEISEKYENGKIAVAHNKNDVAETVIMRLIRGSSVFGLKGIPVKNGNIIRPLLGTDREEIEGYLSKKEIPFVTDSTNLSDDYTRNKIRHKIIPSMKEINEGYLNSLCNTARRMADVSDFLIKSAKESYGEITEIVDIEKLSKLHNALKEYVVTESAYKSGISELSETNIKDILSLMDSESGKQISLPEGYTAIRVYGEIKFQRKKIKEAYYKELKIGKNYIKEAGYTVEITESKKGIDADKLVFPLYARPKKSGDYIEIKGTEGRKKIKKLYIDEKLPLDKREYYPLIMSEEKVVFALGRCGKDFLSDENSKNVYTIKITEGEC